ncbi:hypothetical protein FJ208_02630 [Candidatus Gribaldobacteria bacterium]|nr:hypothetical protein [Candidatus Gribaldobacteria bacterium]
MPNLTIGDNFSKGGRQFVIGPDYLAHPVAEVKAKVKKGEWTNCRVVQDEQGKYRLVDGQ